MGETTASHLSIFTAMVEVVSAAFGGGGKGSKPAVTEDLSQASPEQFASRVNQLLSV